MNRLEYLVKTIAAEEKDLNLLEMAREILKRFNAQSYYEMNDYYDMIMNSKDMASADKFEIEEASLIAWLMEEHQPVYILTEYEKNTLKRAREMEYDHVSRSKNGHILFTRGKGRREFKDFMFDDILKFINAEDVYIIDDILNHSEIEQEEEK